VQGPFPRDDAGATPAVHAGRMNLINVGHGAVALRELADAVHRRDVARYADGDVGRVLPLAEELTRLPVDLIATQGTAYPPAAESQHNCPSGLGVKRGVQHLSAAHQKEGPDRASKTRTGDEQAAFPCHCSDVLAMREKS
jgi:hypothetical protein